MYYQLIHSILQNFIASLETDNVLSQGSVEDLGNSCPRPKAKCNSFLDLHYQEIFFII